MTQEENNKRSEVIVCVSFQSSPPTTPRWNSQGRNSHHLSDSFQIFCLPYRASYVSRISVLSVSVVVKACTYVCVYAFARVCVYVYNGTKKSTLNSVTLLHRGCFVMKCCAHFSSSCLAFYLSDFLRFPEWPVAILKNPACFAAAFRAPNAFNRSFSWTFSTTSSWQITTEVRVISVEVWFKYVFVQKHTHAVWALKSWITACKNMQLSSRGEA